MQNPSPPSPDLVALSSEIVAAYVSHNRIGRADLPDMIAAVHRALAGLGGAAEPEAAALRPPVPIRKSVTPDFIVSLEDGKPYRSLKRHLGTLGLTPDQYRAKWGLPSDYPMVAPNSSKRRSEIAKMMRLGQSRKG